MAYDDANTIDSLCLDKCLITSENASHALSCSSVSQEPKPARSETKEQNFRLQNDPLKQFYVVTGDHATRGSSQTDIPNVVPEQIETNQRSQFSPSQIHTNSAARSIRD